MVTNVDAKLLDSLGLTTRARASAEKSAETKGLGGQDAFMRLILTQMQQQDPLNPMDNTQFLSQMAQFESLNSMRELNSGFGQLASTLQSNQALQASAMVGRSVLVPGKIGVLSETTPILGAVDLPLATPQATVSVMDESGQTIASIDLGQQPAGLAKFAWDGRLADGTYAPPGRYTIKASALQDGKVQGMNTLSVAPVTSVVLGKGGMGLTLNVDGIGGVSLNDVRQIM